MSDVRELADTVSVAISLLGTEGFKGDMLWEAFSIDMSVKIHE